MNMWQHTVSWVYVWNVCVKQWKTARPHYCHSPHCLIAKQREAKRGKAAVFNWKLKERWRQKAQIKQMVESGLESQPVVIRIERKWTAAGITHLGLSVRRGPHRSLRSCIQMDYSCFTQGAVHGPCPIYEHPLLTCLSSSFISPGSLLLDILWTDSYKLYNCICIFERACLQKNKPSESSVKMTGQWKYQSDYKDIVLLPYLVVRHLMVHYTLM